MDKPARMDHLLALLGENRSLCERLEAHRVKLESHHPSRERDRAIVHATKALGRAQKQQRSLERAIRNEGKRAP